MIGTSLSHYRILEKLGEGGMGVVYQAEDTTLRRFVAIKLLPGNAARDRASLDRFEREARTAAALNHPNICVIYEIGWHEGDPFIAMEWLEGRTLRDVIDAHGRTPPLPLETIVELATQLAEGLAAAHARGIVHRDIKPANVFVTRSGQAKILDFGLAKLMDDPRWPGQSDDDATVAATAGSAPKHLTSPGTAVGTVAYMSPEQARGETLDARTDLFSYGTVLYEMCVGRRPFGGHTSGAIFGAILHEAAAPISRFNPALPAALEQIVSKALEKDPRLRYQTAVDILADLKRMKRDFAPPAEAPATDSRGAGSAEQVDAIAVLPFENMSGDPDAEYLSDGITESLINSLAQLGRLRVLARSTVFRYKGRAGDAQQIGTELHARAVLTGRVFLRGDTLVIGAELVSVANGWQLWGERYKRSLTDIFDVQEEIARVIVDKLRVTLSPTEERRLGNRHTDNPEAYQLFLKGLYFWNKWTTEGFRQAEEYFRHALVKDPGYAPAYTGIADMFASPPYMGYVSPRDVFPKAKAAIQTALELDSTFPHAWFLAGIASMVYDWDMRAAEEAFRRAIEVGPGAARGYSGLGYVLGVQGRFAEAVAQAQRAVALEPLTPIWAANAALIYRWMGDNDTARLELQKSLEVDPSFLLNRLELGRVDAASGRLQEALREFERAARDSDGHPFAIGHLGYGYALVNRRDEAANCLGRLQELAGQRYTPASAFALVYLGLGDMERALESLDRAIDDREARMIHLDADPLYDPIRSDPRFRTLLRRVGFAAPSAS